jgi:hypothetical protein
MTYGERKYSSTILDLSTSSASCPGRFIPGKTAPVTHWMARPYSRPKTLWRKQNNSCPCWQSEVLSKFMIHDRKLPLTTSSVLLLTPCVRHHTHDSEANHTSTTQRTWNQECHIHKKCGYIHDNKESYCHNGASPIPPKQYSHHTLASSWTSHFKGVTSQTF